MPKTHRLSPASGPRLRSFLSSVTVLCTLSACCTQHAGDGTEVRGITAYDAWEVKARLVQGMTLEEYLGAIDANVFGQPFSVIQSREPSTLYVAYFCPTIELLRQDHQEEAAKAWEQRDFERVWQILPKEHAYGHHLFAVVRMIRDENGRVVSADYLIPASLEGSTARVDLLLWHP